MSSFTLDLRKVIPPSQWERFVADLIYKPLEQKVKSGELPAKAVRMINTYIEKYGTETIPFSCETVDIPTLHSMQGGLVASIRIPIIKGKHEITAFLKQFKDLASYGRALENQSKVAEALKGTSLEGLVQEPYYSNPESRTILVPFVNGVSLDRTLPLLPADQKTMKLKQALDSYFEWTKALEEKKIDAPRFGDALEATIKSIGATDGDPIITALKPLCDTLSSGRKTVIHGDFNLGNIVEARGSFVPIDFESLALGYLERDVGKMLMKARLTSLELDAIILHSARRQKEIYGDEIEESVKRHRLNLIRQETSTIGVYLSRHQKTQAAHFHERATIAYNTVRKYIQIASAQGYVDGSLLGSFSAFFECKRGLERKSDEEIAEMAARTDFTARPSLEEEGLPQTLEELAEAASATKTGDAKSELERLHKNLNPSKPGLWKRISRLVQTAALPIAVGVGVIAAGLPWYRTMATEPYSALGKTASEITRERNARNYRDTFRQFFFEAMNAVNLKTRFNKKTLEPYGFRGPKELLSRKDLFITEVAKKNGFTRGFIGQVLNVTRYYCMASTEVQNPQYEDINYIESEGRFGRFSRTPSNEMRENISQGAALMASFRDQFRRSYKILSSDLGTAIAYNEKLYSGINPDMIPDYLAGIPFDPPDPLREKINGKDRQAQISAMLDILALKDALISFYARFGDNVYSIIGREDNFDEARAIAYNILHGLNFSEATDEGWFLHKEDYPNSDSPIDSLNRRFHLTSRSALYKEMIGSIDYEDLMEVKATDQALRGESCHTRARTR